MNKKISTIVLIILGLALILAPACTQQTTAPTSTATSGTTTNAGTKTGSGPGTGTANTTTVAGYSVKVTRAGSILATFSVADLDGLSQVSIRADGKDYSGPSILSILAAAGVTDFTKLTIDGYAKGRMATAELPVEKANINNNYMLRKTNQNTFSLASTDVPADSWIIDVEELRVE